MEEKTQNGEGLKASQSWGVWLFTLAFVVLLTPLLQDYFAYLLSRPFYQWAPVFALTVAGLFVVAWRRSEAAETQPRMWMQLGSLGALFAVTAVGYLYFAGWLAILALIAGIAALLVYLSKYRKIDRILGLWMLLFFLIRIPGQVERRLLDVFENLSVAMGSGMLNLFGITHQMRGKFMVIKDYEIDVERICNGYFSIFTLAALTGLYVFLRHRSVLNAAILVPASLLIAAFVNVLRVIAVAFVFSMYGADMMQSWAIFFLFVLSLGLGVLGVMSVDALLVFLWSPVEKTGFAGRIDATDDGVGMARFWNKVVGFRVDLFLSKLRKSGDLVEGPSRVLRAVSVSGVVGLSLFVALILKERWWGGAHHHRFMFSEREELAVIDPAKVRFDRPGWRVLDISTKERELSSLWGRFSTIWRLSYRGENVVMAVDYPFDKWHDVRICYLADGWKTTYTNMNDFGSDTKWGAAETEMLVPTGEQALLLCSHCDHLGKRVTPKPTLSNLRMAGYYLHPKQWQPPFKVNVNKASNTFYQTQAVFISGNSFDEEVKKEVRAMYADFREQVRELIVERSKIIANE